jgi:hypothetical protein
MIKEQIKIEVNRDCGNTTASVVLESLGYSRLDPNLYDGKAVFEKDGKEYEFKEWNYFNTYIYSITLEEMEV